MKLRQLARDMALECLKYGRVNAALRWLMVWIKAGNSEVHWQNVWPREVIRA